MAVDTPSREYDLMRSRWKQMRDCITGSEAIHSAGTTYLPALAGHNPSARTDPYWDYNKRALYYNATARTIDGLEGMVFRRPPIVDLPTAADPLTRDVDNQGRNLDEFSASVLREVLSVGRCGLLLDHTRVEPPAGGQPTEEQQRLGSNRRPVSARPYLVLYEAEQILDVVWETEGGSRRPVQVRLLEVVEVPGDDEFDSKTIEQVRVLELADGVYQQRVFIRQEQGDQQTRPTRLKQNTFTEDEERQVVPTMADGRRFDHIPFWLVGTGAANTPGKIEPPPLLDLADVNLVHYRQDADYRNALHAHGVPTPVFTGETMPSDPIKLGTFEGIWMPNPQAKAMFLSFGREGVDAILQALTNLEQQMAFLGARMLQPDKRGVEAAETARIHRMGEISVLARMSNSVSNALTAAVRELLAWASIPTTDDHVVRLNDDFLPTQAAPQLFAEMVKAWQAGAISHDSLWRFAQEGELVDPRRTIEEELAIIDQEQPEPEEGDELELEAQRIGVEQQRLQLEQQANGAELPVAAE